MRPSLRRAVTVAAWAGLLLAAAPSVAAPPADVSVVVTLRPADPAALRAALALPPTATLAERQAALAAARPVAAADVAAYLRRRGLDVTSESAWVVAARGRRDLARGIAHPQIAHVAGLGPQHEWRPAAVPRGHTGATLRSAYDVVAGRGAGLTVATVQFSGWNPADLAAYARAIGLDDPQPTEVYAGGSPRTTPEGAFEAALDHEVLLAAAPDAEQRMYLAPNTGLATAALLYDRIADDAEAGVVQVVSTSWGMCEDIADDDPDARAAVEVQLARIVAAGATVFAASGDTGAFGCSRPAYPDPTVSVGYPAASPYVVGVGGTRLTGRPGVWTETGWSMPRSGAFAGYASGGGESTTVPRPAWQRHLTLGQGRRLVPDVAAVAHPGDGFGAYVSGYGGWLVAGGTSVGAPLLAGQLASVISAQGRTAGVGSIHDELYAHPRAFRDITSGSNLLHKAGSGYDLVTGLGSPRWSGVAAALFGAPVVSAPAYSRSLTVPVTVEQPPGVTTVAWRADEGRSIACDPSGSPSVPTSVTLLAGDRLTRVAVGVLDATARCRVGTAPVLVDTRKPVARAGIRPLRYDERTVFTWGATDPAPSSGVLYAVCVEALGGGCVFERTRTSGRSVTLTLTRGRTYVLRVTPTDRAGNRGAAVAVRYTVPVDSASMSRSGSWAAIGTASSWYRGHLTTTRAGSALAKRLTGTRYEVGYVAQPGGGVFDVYVDGAFVERVRTYASATAYRRFRLVATYARRATRSVRIVARSGRVSIDAVRVAY